MKKYRVTIRQVNIGTAEIEAHDLEDAKNKCTTDIDSHQIVWIDADDEIVQAETLDGKKKLGNFFI